MLGSVTAWDVMRAAERQYGVVLHESHLMMDGPITAFGTFKVPLNLRTKEDRSVRRGNGHAIVEGPSGRGGYVIRL